MEIIWPYHQKKKIYSLEFHTLIMERKDAIFREKRKIKKIQLAAGLYCEETYKKHDIPYFLSYGTMLGAPPHKGMIPWDD